MIVASAGMAEGEVLLDKSFSAPPSGLSPRVNVPFLGSHVRVLADGQGVEDVEDVVVGSRHAAETPGVSRAPGGHWVAGFILARWLQLVVAAPHEPPFAPRHSNADLLTLNALAPTLKPTFTFVLHSIRGFPRGSRG
ncbi:hypothetical protein KM043_003495 [Ampulex compressa]|nr:hypothetical protein KM043_003495 [Ampulex compressa]